jgi:predicted RNA binding protein YcfA (HicA-like mRNA interferase family)
MSPKLPKISGRKAITVFETIGYQLARQKGSHIRLRDDKNPCNHEA